MPLGTEVGGPNNFVLDGDPTPPPKKGTEPQFSAHAYCCQTAGWIKMALGMKVGLGPRHVVLDGDPAPVPPKRGHNLPIVGPFLLWPNGWMHRDATWYGVGPLFGGPAESPSSTMWPRPRPHCARW